MPDRMNGLTDLGNMKQLKEHILLSEYNASEDDFETFYVGKVETILKMAK